MGITKIKTNEYECERCGYKWLRRVDGKDLEGLPWGCARCKTYLWNKPRINNMLYGSYVYASSKDAKEYQKLKFLDVFNNRSEEDYYRLEKCQRDQIDTLAYELGRELSSK